MLFKLNKVIYHSYLFRFFYFSFEVPSLVVYFQQLFDFFQTIIVLS